MLLLLRRNLGFLRRGRQRSRVHIDLAGGRRVTDAERDLLIERAESSNFRLYLGKARLHLSVRLFEGSDMIARSL